MITGLRGAADTSGDNKVTLNELYSYAFNDTLSKTETSKAGPQHPNYNITLVGSGDLVLSDLSAGEAMLSLTKEAKGKFIIRDGNDKLVSEINKSAGQPITMALPSGQYSATIIDEYSSRQGIFYLNKDQIYTLDSNSLTKIQRKNARLRGNDQLKDEEADYKVEDAADNEDDVLSLYGLDKKEERAEVAANDKELDIDLVEEDDYEDDYIAHPRFDFDFSHLDFGGFSLSLVPGFTLVEAGSDLVNAAVGIFGSKVTNLYGIQYSDIINIGDGRIVGAQISNVCNITHGKQAGTQIAGVFNITEAMSGSQIGGCFNIADYISGPQIGGLFNISQRVDGVQIGGIFNYAKQIKGSQIGGVINVAKKINGAQIGLINVADENNGITIGLLNLIGNGLCDISVAWNTDNVIDWYFQNGSRHLYTVIGFPTTREAYESEFEDFGGFYYGLGTQIKFPTTSVELEFLHKMYWFEENAYPELRSSYNKLSTAEKFMAISIPSFRANFNFFETKYAAVFTSFMFDFNYIGYNDIAFKLYDRNLCIEGDEVNVYASISVGAKIRL